MYGDGHQHIRSLQEPSQLVSENLLPLSVVGPGCVERNVVREASNVEGRLPAGNDKLSQITCEMLSGGGRSTVSQGVDSSFVAVALQKNLPSAFDGHWVKLSKKPSSFVKKDFNFLKCVWHV